jgi:hypothetical protein
MKRQKTLHPFPERDTARRPWRDYVRHGTTTLFAALDILDGTVIGRCMQRHRHQEFLRFLNAVEAAVPAGLSEISCCGGHDEGEGGPTCRAAKSRRSRT